MCCECRCAAACVDACAPHGRANCVFLGAHANCEANTEDAVARQCAGIFEGFERRYSSCLHQLAGLLVV